MTPLPICKCGVVKQNNLPCSPPKNGPIPSSCMTREECQKFCSKRGGMISYNPCATRKLLKKICDTKIDTKAQFCFSVANQKNTRCLNNEDPICNEYWRNSLAYGFKCSKLIVTNTNCVRWVCTMFESRGFCTSIETYQCVNSSCQCARVICFT